MHAPQVKHVVGAAIEALRVCELFGSSVVDISMQATCESLWIPDEGEGVWVNWFYKW